jgi:hypothetical protein
LASDLTAAWEFLTGATRARLRLATARPLIWAKTRLPTAEHTTILRLSPARGNDQPTVEPATDFITIRISIETLLQDGRRLASCVDLVAGRRRWFVRPYIALGDALDRPLWEGQVADRDDSAGFADAADAAAQALLEATLSLDVAAI